MLVFSHPERYFLSRTRAQLAGYCTPRYSEHCPATADHRSLLPMLLFEQSDAVRMGSRQFQSYFDPLCRTVSGELAIARANVASARFFAS